MWGRYGAGTWRNLSLLLGWILTTCTQGRCRGAPTRPTCPGATLPATWKSWPCKWDSVAGLAAFKTGWIFYDQTLLGEVENLMPWGRAWIFCWRNQNLQIGNVCTQEYEQVINEWRCDRMILGIMTPPIHCLLPPHMSAMPYNRGGQRRSLWPPIGYLSTFPLKSSLKGFFEVYNYKEKGVKKGGGWSRAGGGGDSHGGGK